MRAAQQAARDAERRFPVRIRVAVPGRGLGERLNRMQEWLDQNAGADGWAMTPSGMRGVLNDAILIHLADATIASHSRPAECRAVGGFSIRLATFSVRLMILSKGDIAEPRLRLRA